MSRGILVVLSGFSGAGKGTLIKRLLEKYDHYALSISVTTRPPREGEKDGREYFFRSRAEFESLIGADRFIEYAEYVGNYYGTPKDYVEEQLQTGKDVILEIEIQGALKVKEKLVDTPLLFVSPPSAQELKRRLEERGTESPEMIRDRLRKASEEAKEMPGYDYLLINDDLETCVDVMHQVIQSERCRMQRSQDFAQKIAEELKEFVKGEETI